VWKYILGAYTHSSMFHLGICMYLHIARPLVPGSWIILFHTRIPALKPWTWILANVPEDSLAERLQQPVGSPVAAHLTQVKFPLPDWLLRCSMPTPRQPKEAADWNCRLCHGQNIVLCGKVTVCELENHHSFIGKIIELSGPWLPYVTLPEGMWFMVI